MPPDVQPECKRYRTPKSFYHNTRVATNGVHRKAGVRDIGVPPGMVIPIMAPKRGVYAKDKSERRNWKLETGNWEPWSGFRNQEKPWLNPEGQIPNCKSQILSRILNPPP